MNSFYLTNIRQANLFTKRQKDLFECRLRDAVGFNVQPLFVLLEQLKEFSRGSTSTLKDARRLSRFFHFDLKAILRVEKRFDRRHRSRHFHFNGVSMTEFRFQMLNRAETCQLTLLHDSQPLTNAFANSQREDGVVVGEVSTVLPFIHRMTGENES